jgi:cyanate lyase
MEVGFRYVERLVPSGKFLGAVANPKGDRVKIAMSGKFLPYKYYGASGNVPEYEFKDG